MWNFPCSSFGRLLTPCLSCIAQETKSGRLTTLPPPPDEVGKGKKARTSDMPRSLQKMVMLQVCDEVLARLLLAGDLHSTELLQSHEIDVIGLINAQEAAKNSGRKGGGRAQPKQTVGSSSQAGLTAVGRSTQQQPEGQAGPSGRTEDADSSQQPQSSLAPPHVPAQAKPAAAATTMREPEAEPTKSRLKQRKKEYLQRRKLKKSGRTLGADGAAAEAEEDLEARLLQDAHKPRFGEQALAPLKVSPKGCFT